SHAGCQLAVLTTLKKDRHDNLRITSRRHTDEPAVIFVLVAFSLSLSEFVTHDLGAARFSGKINPLQVRAAGGPNWIHHLGHCVSNRFPAFGVDRDVSDLLIATPNFFVLR